MAKSPARRAWCRRARASIYLAGDADACKKAERVVAGFADSCLYFGEFGAASRVKLINNLAGRDQHRGDGGSDGAWAEGGVDVPLMIKAVATGSGGSTQFGIRAPWMAERRFQPVQGRGAGALQHYFDMIGDMADQLGVATPILDCVTPLYQRFMDMGFGGDDVARMVDVLSALPREKH